MGQCWGPGNDPLFPFSSLKWDLSGLGIPTFPFSLAGTGHSRDPSAQVSPQRRTSLGFSKERAERDLGVPWTLPENCYARLWLLIYWLMRGLYDPLTVLYGKA